MEIEPQIELVEEVIIIIEINIDIIITKLEVGIEPLVIVSKYDEMSYNIVSRFFYNLF